METVKSILATKTGTVKHLQRKKKNKLSENEMKSDMIQ